VALGRDLPALWKAETTTSADRKQMLRLVIRDVIVDGKRAQGQVWVHINWQTGAHEEFWYTRSVRSYEASADGHSDCSSASGREISNSTPASALYRWHGLAPAPEVEPFDGQNQREGARSSSMGRWNLFSRRRCSPTGSLPRDYSPVAEGGQTHRIPTRQRDALEGIRDRRRSSSAPGMASTSKTMKEKGMMMHSRMRFWPRHCWTGFCIMQRLFLSMVRALG